MEVMLQTHNNKHFSELAPHHGRKTDCVDMVRIHYVTVLPYVYFTFLRFLRRLSTGGNLDRPWRSCRAVITLIISVVVNECSSLVIRTTGHYDVDWTDDTRRDTRLDRCQSHRYRAANLSAFIRPLRIPRRGWRRLALFGV